MNPTDILPNPTPVKTMVRRKRNRKREEFFNVVTHGAGVVLSAVALALMTHLSATRGTTLQLFVSVVFGSSLVLLYAASTLYHAMSRLRWKRRFQIIDHLCIYVLIAGTYTPVALLGLKGNWGWTIFALIWIFAGIGFVFKLSPLRKREKLSLLLYLAMGWLIVIALGPLLKNMATEPLLLLLMGGVCYTGGVYFFVKERVPYYHAVWHVFVLAGSAFHFFGIFLYLLPTA
ncbi:PAQR family membrane homeostasis protein TrhA [Flavobacterium caeni]|uniref:Hemolysin III n=1 Tax=Flavobacterium caeni TaxID=490189 RepID=A0A1G5JIA6_9FLAO|nr:hemolysin III family protein [Flavobacterium caeni]SCY88112.1 hemolysin III [Flavobacterium caeni]